jgi:plastocyanin
MRLRRRYLLAAALLGVAVAVLPAIASSETTPVEAVNEGGGVYGETHRWSPSQETVIAGNAVTFRNMTAVRHGVNWINPPAKPVCDNTVPVGTTEAAAGTNWSGTCTFAQAGTYTFYCTVHGAAMSGTITVTNGKPTVTTGAATPVTEHEATLKGTVNPNGKATKYFFKWGTTGSYGQETSMQSAGEGTAGVPVSATLKGLASGTTYHFRLIAENEKGSAEGADETFTTTSPPPPPGPPTATTGEATSVSDTEETLKGMVNPDGEATKYVFDYGTDTGYGQHSTELTLAASDHTSHPVSATLTGLAPGTTYHFRLVAKNAKGPAEGADGVFKTLSPPPFEPSPRHEEPPSSPPATISSASPSPEPKPVPLVPALVEGSLKLSSPRRGSSVRGSVEVAKSAAGERLEVDLLANSASLAKVRHKRSASTVVGRLVRASVPAGKVFFSISLNARAKSALHRHHKLALTVQIVLTPVAGASVSVTRSVVLRG